MDSKNKSSNFQIDYIRSVMQVDQIAGQELVRSNKSLISRMVMSNQAPVAPGKSKKKSKKK